MRHFILLVACLMLGACATNIVAEKASRFDEAVAAYDAGDFATAYQIWDALAREDDLAAKRNVAQLLRHGRGVEKDTARAFKLYTEAAEKGLVTAMANLGDMYLAGEGVERNPQAAAAWYARAASAGLSLAQWKLAEMYERGDGIPIDAQRARSLLERAARNGYAPAQEKLQAQGVTLDETENTESTAPLSVAPVGAEPSGTPEASPEPVLPPASSPTAGMSPGDPILPDLMGKMPEADLTLVHAGLAAYNATDRKRALQIWLEAAMRGVADAQLRTGLMHARGEGAGRDVIEAYRWLRHAAGQGHPQAIAELARLSTKLSVAERAIGESLVREPLESLKKPD